MKKSLQLVEVTLNKKQLEDALRSLNESKKEQFTFVVSESRLVGAEISGGFLLKPGFVHCRYGCQDEEEKIVNAVRTRKGKN